MWDDESWFKEKIAFINVKWKYCVQQRTTHRMNGTKRKWNSKMTRSINLKERFQVDLWLPHWQENPENWKGNQENENQLPQGICTAERTEMVFITQRTRALTLDFSIPMEDLARFTYTGTRCHSAYFSIDVWIRVHRTSMQVRFFYLEINFCLLERHQCPTVIQPYSSLAYTFSNRRESTTFDDKHIS